jgi:hypothetical protein
VLLLLLLLLLLVVVVLIVGENGLCCCQGLYCGLHSCSFCQYVACGGYCMLG